ncbi:MAG: DUF3592 domain-containing protein, partial [Streptosporangiaceae bacterium]
MDFFAYAPLFFVAIGLLIAGGGVRQILLARTFAARAHRVPGTVTDVRTRLSGSRERLRARQSPMLTFTTLDGRQITTEARESSDRGIGNTVGVLYNPTNPTEALGWSWAVARVVTESQLGAPFSEAWTVAGVAVVSVTSARSPGSRRIASSVSPESLVQLMRRRGAPV